MTSALDLIRQSGDILEQMMFADDEFAAQFSLYPQVWARCILPNRKEGTIALTSDRWIRFAERHYTTIVRCWNARTAHADICEQCQSLIDSNDAVAYLKLHQALFAFFCLCGSAVDNLEWTFKVPPVESDDAFQKSKTRHNGHLDLRWFYERRTQFVHKAVVPCFGYAGLAAFDLNMFVDPETRWDSTHPVKIDSIADHVAKLWLQFVEEMKAAWSELLRVVKTVTSVRPSELVLTIQQPASLANFSAAPFTIASGVPSFPGSGNPLYGSSK